jgi:dihydrofolate synthase/folylpolyglutamate synthase
MAGSGVDYLYSLTLHGIKLGLSNIRALLEAAGNPQDAYPCIHVAGTNGKGSTLAMLGAMLHRGGIPRRPIHQSPLGAAE